MAGSTSFSGHGQKASRSESAQRLLNHFEVVHHGADLKSLWLCGYGRNQANALRRPEAFIFLCFPSDLGGASGQDMRLTPEHPLDSRSPAQTSVTANHDIFNDAIAAPNPTQIWLPLDVVVMGGANSFPSGGA